MPYKKDGSDAPANVPADKAAQWAAVFNEVYDKALKDGKTKAEAENLAFTEAYGVIKQGATMKPILFRAQNTAGDLTIEMYDMIGTDFLGQGINTKAVSDAIKAAGDHKSITMRINSPGGDAFEGVSIYNLLKSQNKPVNVIVDGLAASAASIVAMAGDTIEMGKGTMLMIHPAMTFAAGDAAEMRKAAATLDAVSSSMADIYVARTQQPKAQITDWMNAETWMNPTEAVSRGFATSVSNQQAHAMAFDLTAIPVFRNLPEQFKASTSHTKSVDGENLKEADFIYTGDPTDVSTWHLPWHFSTEASTVDHLRNALARFDQTKEIPESARPAAKAKLDRLAKEHGIDVGGQNPPPTAQVEDPTIGVWKKRIEIMKQRS